MNNFLQTPIEFLKGIGPQKAEVLQKELRIFKYADLLEYYPYRYVDRSKFHKISELHLVDGFAQLKGRITRIYESGAGRAKRLHASFQDDTGVVDLVWFKGGSWVRSSLRVNEDIIVFGKPTIFKGQWNIPHPEFGDPKKAIKIRFEPVYSSTDKLNRAGLNTKGIQKSMLPLLSLLKGQIEELLPASTIAKHHLISREEALYKIHLPHSELDARNARLRLKFEELFFLQLELLMRKKIGMEKLGGFIFKKVGNEFNEFYKKHIPFELTGAQKRVLKEIRKDFATGHHMNRLLQGDVGSGKTLVALLTMLLAIGNGFQTALIAPTEILAIQHFESIQEMLAEMNLEVRLLTGSTKKKDRRILHEELRSGKIDILIGTHALFEDVVQFKNLGLVVIDEQHRFGVAQRAKMRKKNTTPPHILVMTATPIPRTLAMTFYGDLDVSVIDEMPPGRKSIITLHKKESSRARLFGFMREQIELGRQIYMVYPLIEESETLDYNNLLDGFEAVTRSFPRPKYQLSIVHGRMKPADKEFEMNRFAKGETQIMVATTVIEVGVNVPNASVMVIESAERFGLSQLHQLRGRVGRGSEQSYCILVTGKEISKDSKKRMQTMVQTNDGFEISEVDLQLRGPGDIMGTQQSGLLDLKIANLATDGGLVSLARDAAKELLKDDPKIEKEENKGVREFLVDILRNKPDWAKIG